MELLAEIKDKEIPQTATIKRREAVRAVLFDGNYLVPLLFIQKHKFHKLPGGGIESGEDISTALAREVLEEVGCTFRTIAEIGKTIEYRSRWKLYQTSYAYIGTITSKGETNFTKKESKDGFKVVWLSLADAILAVQNDRTDDYEGGFVQKRELALLRKAEQIRQSAL